MHGRPWRAFVKVSAMKQDVDEIVARAVAGETLRDVRTVRREMREPGSVRGLAGQQIRAALARHRRMANAQSARVA